MNEHDDTPSLPWSNVAEQSVIGGALLDPDALLALGDRRPQPAHFFDRRHRYIWAAMLEMADRRLPIDTITVFERLRDIHKANECGGLTYLNAVAQCVPSAHNIATYAGTVVRKAVLRNILAATDQAQQLARDPGALDADQVLDQVATLFSGIKRTKPGSTPRRLGELIGARLDHWHALATGETTAGIPTGISSLDEALGGGLKAGRVIVMAARPSVGKTSLASAIGLRISQAGHAVLMLSQEMPGGDLADRAAASLGGVRLDRIATGGFAGDDWALLLEAAESASAMPFYVDDQPALTLLDIRAKARQVKQQGGLSLLIVDYLQLCASSSRFDKRHHQIEEISRGMKTLAKELDVCVLLLSQLNRESEREEPELSHLKESGSIEEDADVVVLLHPMGNEPDGRQLILAKIPKNRQGRRGRLALAFDGKTQRWDQSDSNVSRRGGGPCSRDL